MNKLNLTPIDTKRIARLLPGAVLAALPGLAHAASAGEMRTYEVVAAFAALVVAATAASIVTAYSQRDASNALAQPEAGSRR